MDNMNESAMPKEDYRLAKHSITPLYTDTFVYISDRDDLENLVQIFYPPRFPDPDDEQYVPQEIHSLDDTASKFGSSTPPPEDHLGYEDSKNMCRILFSTIWRHAGPFTVVVEDYHVNPSYRDSYYTYFAGQHFDTRRFAARLSLFIGDVSGEDAFSPENSINLNNSFIGSFVIYPTEARTLGRVLIKPEYLLKSNISCEIRLTDYSITVFGIRLSLKAFPFQMQDRETTRCAEVTLLNILDYFGSTYSEYRTYLPGEIIALEQQFTSDRTLPSRGINYSTMSKLLTKFGFSPRLYSVRALQREAGSKAKWSWKQQEIRRLLHYYIESGIPVAVNVAHSIKQREPGHSIVCIGYANTPPQEALKFRQINNGPRLFNSADYYNDYIVIDDNQAPYSIRKFEMLSRHEDYKVDNILVPLYKRMYLEASDAYDVAQYILEHENYGIVARYPDFPKDEDLVVRLFLASSRTFKVFRIENSNLQDLEHRRMYRMLYGEIPLPRFIWVAELFTKSNFEAPNGNAFGEIILDATAATKNDVKSVIMLNYPKSVAARWPESSISDLNNGFENFCLAPFPRFTGNLKTVTGA